MTGLLDLVVYSLRPSALGETPSVCLQALTQLGRDWLFTLCIGVRAGEAVILTTLEDIEDALNGIPESLHTMTLA